MISLRRRLLLLMLGIFVFAWITVTAVTYLQSHRQIAALRDAQLAQNGAILETILNDELQEFASTPHHHILKQEPLVHPYQNQIYFQLWQDGDLLFASRNAPREPLAQGPGFSDQNVEDTCWRVFGMDTETPGQILYVGESHEVHDALVRIVTFNTLLPILWFTPLFGLLIWFGVHRGLHPLQRLSGEIARRTPSQLDDIADDRAPTEVQPLIAALNGLFHSLRESLARERRFTSDAAHELRTPLTGVKTHAQLAYRSDDRDQIRACLSKVIEGVDQSAHLVAQLLTLARMEPENRHIERVPCPLLPLAQEVAAEMFDQARRKQVELELTHDRPRCLVISGYQAGLKILLRNLVANAIKYSPSNATVRIDLRRDGNRVCMRVGDQGPGIPESERAKVFERFYRPPGQIHYGSGLGLAIGKQICEFHGAEIQLAAADGQGLLVTVRFPATR